MPYHVGKYGSKIPQLDCLFKWDYKVWHSILILKKKYLHAFLLTLPASF